MFGDKVFKYGLICSLFAPLLLSCGANQRIVRWLNYDGSCLQSSSFAVGEVPTYEGEQPTREGNDAIHYVFTGWSPELAPVTEDATYVAQFDAELNSYTVTWENHDGTVLATEVFDYGSMPVYKGEAPTKAATPQYTYTFSGWSPELAPVTADATYVAQFDAELNSYTVTWENYDGTVLLTEKVPYGSTPKYSGDEPAHEDAGKYGYAFSGWDPEIVAIDGHDATYRATFEEYVSCYVGNFVHDENVEVWVYGSQDYTTSPVKSDIGYSTDKTGVKTLTDGQINFKLGFADGYALDDIIIEKAGAYKNLKTPDETGEKNTYRITKITDDLSIRITAKKLDGAKMLTGFSSYVDDDGLAHFSWSAMDGVDKVTVLVNDNQVENTMVVEAPSSSFEYQLSKSTSTRFTFTPHHESKAVGESISLSRFYVPSVSAEILHAELETEGYLLPSYDIAYAPEGCWGASLKNANYVPATFKFYSETGGLLFDSTSSLSDPENPYAGAKIKLRGNTSAFGWKKPYKLKLNSKSDLGLMSRKNKSWILLAQGHSLDHFIGRETASYVETGYNLEYRYIYLTVNGNYEGLYILSEGVDEKTCGVGAEGFVIENDAYWWNEPLSFETPLTSKHVPVAYTFKYPDSDDITDQSPEYVYIRDHMSLCEGKLINGDEDALDYYDLASLARWLIIHDLLATWDSGGSNKYLVKADQAESKIQAGPAWDFDTILRADMKGKFANIHHDGHYLFPYLFGMSEFEQTYKTILGDLLDGYLDALAAHLSVAIPSALDGLIPLDAVQYHFVPSDSATQYASAVSYLSERILWLKAELGL